MRTMNYTQVRGNLASVLDSVTDDRDEVIVTRAGREDVVMVSAADYSSLKETAYLLSTPANARRLLDAVDRLRSGKGKARELIDADDETSGGAVVG